MAFIDFLLNPDIKKRPSAREALNHPWLKEVNHKSWDKQRTEGVLENITKFHASSLIHKALYEYIGVHMVTSEERETIDAIWDVLDEEKTGTLNKSNLK
jgi:hypothetical protein